jgi:hypothetical protein
MGRLSPSSGPLAPEAARNWIALNGALASSLVSRGGLDPSAKVAEAISPKTIRVHTLRFGDSKALLLSAAAHVRRQH